ncbi:hypothetical protein AAE478_006596 [Parahypoxylon ruwenzoriense]
MPVSWDDKSDRDLLLAMLFNSKGTGPEPGKLKVPWEPTARTFQALGYEGVSKDAINQRWLKQLLPGLKRDVPALFTADAWSGTADAPVYAPRRPTWGRLLASKRAADLEDDESEESRPKKRARSAAESAAEPAVGGDDELEDDSGEPRPMDRPVNRPRSVAKTAAKSAAKSAVDDELEEEIGSDEQLSKKLSKKAHSGSAAKNGKGVKVKKEYAEEVYPEEI